MLKLCSVSFVTTIANVLLLFAEESPIPAAAVATAFNCCCYCR
jgi:hypothetical protein